jgi:hypothetical protein
MAPKLVQEETKQDLSITEKNIQVVPEITNQSNTIVQFVLENMDEPVVQQQPAKPEEPLTETAVAVNSFLAKPARIYDHTAAVATEIKQQTGMPENIIELSIDTPVENEKNEAATLMGLIIKEPSTEQEVPMAETEQMVQPGMGMEQSETENAGTEEDSLSRSAERTKKLRNLSFNFNEAENDVFENEPAFLRRKNEIHNTLANVEKFYSNYTVSVDENNESKINTNSKNSFLEGEKPD